MRELDDVAILDRAANGDQAALSELLWRDYDRLASHIDGLIPTRLRSNISADDVMQETLTAAWLNITSFSLRDSGSFFAWLRTIGRRKLVDRVREMSRQKRGGGMQSSPKMADYHPINLLEIISDDGSGPSSVAAGHEAEAKLQDALIALPERHRSVLEFRYIDGLNVEVVANRMNCSAGAVHMLTSRAIEKLRQLLGRESRYFTVK